MICNNSCVIKCYKVDCREEWGVNIGINLFVLKVMNLEEIIKLM